MPDAHVAVAVRAVLGNTEQTSPPANRWSARDLGCLPMEQEDEMRSTDASPAPLSPLSAWQWENPQLYQLRRHLTNSALPPAGPFGTVNVNTTGLVL